MPHQPRALLPEITAIIVVSTAVMATSPQQQKLASSYSNTATTPVSHQLPLIWELRSNDHYFGPVPEASQLLTSNGTKAVALDAGTNGQVLTINSSAANCIEWAALPTTPAGRADYGIIIGTTPQNGTGTISIGYGAGALDSTATNCIIVGTNSNCRSSASNTIILGTSTTTTTSNEFNLPQMWQSRYFY